MDDDLNEMSRDALIEMVRRLRAGIRKHRDSTGHDLWLVSSAFVGAAAGSPRARYRSAAVAEFLARLRCISREPGQGTA